MEREEGDPADASRELRSKGADIQPRRSSHTRRKLWSGWFSFASGVVVWLFCQMEAPLLPSVPLGDECWGFLLLGALWLLLAVGFSILRRQWGPQWDVTWSPQLGAEKEERPRYEWVSQRTTQGPPVPLGLAVADSLLLCVLHEPMSPPSVAHIQTLLCRLKSVSHSLRAAHSGSEVTSEDQDSALKDRVKVIHTYVDRRMTSLQRLVQSQRDLEASVLDTLERIDNHWAQLEELHTGVTLTKEGGRGYRDLDQARRGAQTLYAALTQCRSRLQRCHAHLKDSTQLLQELTWSHAHMSSSPESVWTELLLQSNIEQFDKVEERFLSLEQQTSTFQAHLEGLEKERQEGLTGPRARADGASSTSGSPQVSPHVQRGRWSASSGHRFSSYSASSADAGSRRSLALKFSSTFGSLCKSGRKK